MTTLHERASDLASLSYAMGFISGAAACAAALGEMAVWVFAAIALLSAVVSARALSHLYGVMRGKDEHKV